MSGSKTDLLLQAGDFGPDYQTWDESIRIMFLEKRIFLLKKQMTRQERLADNQRSLYKSIHQEYEEALKQLQDKHNQLKKVSSELRTIKKNLQREVRRQTRELEQKNTALEKHARQLERSNIALDVLLQRGDEQVSTCRGGVDLLELSDREAVVARLISQGRTCREAADFLGISLRGVQSHCYNIRRKLGLSRKVRLRDYLRQKQDG